MTVLIALLGLGFTAFGGWAAVDPSTFPAAQFPPPNPHLVHDVGAAFAAFGVGLLIAAWMRPWRTPVLAVAALWNVLHGIAHLVDVDQADTRSHGVNAAIEVWAVAVLLLVLAWRSRRAE